jgi:hypothetical protein
MRYTLLLPVIALFTISSYAQELLVEEGNASFLKGEKSFKIEYDYENMGVGKFEKEADYVKSKVDDYESKEKGKGEKWKAGWLVARKNLYEPKFEELLNKYISEVDMSAFPSKTTAKYTLILKTIFTEPGFNIGIMRMPASINVEYIFVETADKSKVVAKFKASKVPGRDVSGYDFDAGARIQESYAKAGKILGKYFIKQFQVKK